MFIYLLLFALPVYSFVLRANCGYKKMYVFNSSPKIENIVNENIKDFSTEFIKPIEIVIDEPEPETTVTEVARTGKFVDQDGKSNVWSVDPIIKVDETNKSNISILLNMMTGLGTLSILVYMLSQVFPDY